MGTIFLVNVFFIMYKGMSVDVKLTTLAELHGPNMHMLEVRLGRLKPSYDTLVFHLDYTLANYNHSLSWVPSNLTHMVETLLCKLGIQSNLCTFNQQNQSACIILLKPVQIYCISLNRSRTLINSRPRIGRLVALLLNLLTRAPRIGRAHPPVVQS